MRDEIDQSTPARILSRVDENRKPSNTIKHKNPSNLSDIYIKLSDCQAACRLVKILFYNRNLINYSLDVGLLNIKNKIKQIFPLHILVSNIDIGKANCQFVIVIFLCLSTLYPIINTPIHGMYIQSTVIEKTFEKCLARKFMIHLFVLV